MSTQAGADPSTVATAGSENSAKTPKIAINLPPDMPHEEEELSVSLCQAVLGHLQLTVNNGWHMEWDWNRFMVKLVAERKGLPVQDLAHGYHIMPGRELVVPRLLNDSERDDIKEAVEANSNWSWGWGDESHIAIEYTGPRSTIEDAAMVELDVDHPGGAP